jgi:hypothetical protein
MIFLLTWSYWDSYCCCRLKTLRLDSSLSNRSCPTILFSTSTQIQTKQHKWFGT